MSPEGPWLFVRLTLSRNDAFKVANDQVRLLEQWCEVSKRIDPCGDFLARIIGQHDVATEDDLHLGLFRICERYCD